jgi:hypothetical protein
VATALGQTNLVACLAGVEEVPERTAASRFSENAGGEPWCPGTRRNAGSHRGGAPWSADRCDGQGFWKLEVLQDAVKKIPGKVRPAVATTMVFCHDKENPVLMYSVLYHRVLLQEHGLFYSLLP